MKLSELAIGSAATITSVGGEGAIRQHFLDMGLIPTAEIVLEKFAPLGDPIEFSIHGYQLTLRVADAEKIEVSAPHEKSVVTPTEESVSEVEHPGLGEGGKYHSKADEDPLPDGTPLTFALAGNQNCGKTTLFNCLTGANQHVGNFPGVTVDQKSGKIKGKTDALITDLPGIYSLSPYSEEEIVSRKFILDSKPTCIIDIVDANNIERNLYLTMQLMELEVPMVLALNMMDEVRGNGGFIDVNAMESLLGIPVIPISDATNEGVDELISHALHVAQYQERPGRTDFCDKNDNGGAVHRCLHGIMHLIEDHAKAAGLPVRFAASKLVEGDHLVREKLNLDENELEMVEHVILQLEKERGLDRAAAMADMRYSFISKLCSGCVKKPHESKERVRSQKIDRILTGKYTAIPAFVLIMAAVFFLTFRVIGYYMQMGLELGIDALSNLVAAAFARGNVHPIVQSLVLKGIFQGVGTVLSFIPIVVVLFFFLSLLEDSGYMARVAFVMDKLLRKLGLSGKSIVPMLIGFGCTVPGVMSTRTLSSERDRKMTILLTPFMSCSAKLPIYAFLSSAFFGKLAWLVMIGMYFIGMFVGVLVALISKVTVFKGEAVPFVMELPNYRLPSPKNVFLLLWDKTKDFLKRAFTVILIASIVIWLLNTLDFGFQMAEDSADSILAKIAGFIAPVFYPLGFGKWQIVTALITGFMAKESVVSTLEVLGGVDVLLGLISPCAAFSLLVFCTLYTPCVAAITSIRRELGFKWSIFCIVFQCVIAWIFAGIVSLIGLIFGVW